MKGGMTSKSKRHTHPNTNQPAKKSTEKGASPGAGAITRVVRMFTLTEWVGVLTLAVSAISVAIFIEANRISEEANLVLIESNAARLKVLEGDFQRLELLTITGCRSEDDTYYNLN